MKDHSDKSTHDIFTGSVPVGRPRKHLTNADKQRAYRARKKQDSSQTQAKRPSMNAQPIELMSKTFNFVHLDPIHPSLQALGCMRVVSVVLHESEEAQLGLRPSDSSDADDIEYYCLSELEIKNPFPAGMDGVKLNKKPEMLEQKPGNDVWLLDDSIGDEFEAPEQDEALLSASFHRLSSRSL